MLARMLENLDRQERGILLLESLLQEEFSLLRKNNSQEVSRLELSIQDLMRQLMQERICLKKMVHTVNKGAKRLADLMDVMPAEGANAIRKRLASIDDAEQRSARQAAKNRALALALHEQSSSVLKFIHEKIQPKNRNTYSRQGRYSHSAPAAALLSGRF